MAANREHLVPTTVTNRLGHSTTVYVKPGDAAVAPANGPLTVTGAPPAAAASLREPTEESEAIYHSMVSRAEVRFGPVTVSEPMKLEVTDRYRGGTRSVDHLQMRIEGTDVMLNLVADGAQWGRAKEPGAVSVFPSYRADFDNSVAEFADGEFGTDTVEWDADAGRAMFRTGARGELVPLADVSADTGPQSEPVNSAEDVAAIEEDGWDARFSLRDGGNLAGALLARARNNDQVERWLRDRGIELFPTTDSN